MGKEEHGGPFTAKQVEDVKVHAKLFCVLITLGPIFAVDIVTSVTLFLQSLPHTWMMDC